MKNFRFNILLICLWNLNFTYLFANLSLDTIKVKSMPDDTAKVNLLLSISERLYDFNTDIGVEYANQAIAISRILNYKQGIARSYKAYGIHYWRMGVYDKALDNLYIAIPIYQDLNDLLSVCKCYNNIGLIYFARADLESARKNFKNGYKIAQSLHNKVEQARIKHNSGLLEFEYGNKDTAFKLFKDSYTFASDANERRLMAFNEVFLGRSFTHYKKYDSARVYLEKGIAHFTELDAPNNVAMAYNQFADYFIGIKNYNKAIEYANKADSLGNIIGNKYMQMESAKFIAIAYEKMNDYRSALKFKILYYELVDTMKNETNIKNVAEIESKFKYEQQIRDLKVEKEKEVYENQMIAKSLLIISLILFVLLLFVLLFLRWKNKTNKILIHQNTEIKDLNIKLNEANSTKDKFFSIIAHDLKNPIGNFKNITQMMHEEYQDFTEEERINFLRMMKESSENIYELLENLLEWSRAQRGNIKVDIQEFDLSYLLTSLTQLLKLSADNKNINLVNKIENNTFINADVYLINTVIRNLISNAIKFTPEGGMIEIGAIKIPSEGLEPSEGSIHIYVKDSGVGMDKEMINKLFRIDVNVTSEGTNKEKGTGLGLILCKEFIEKHNGSIWVESELGVGSTFWISLPM